MTSKPGFFLNHKLFLGLVLGIPVLMGVPYTVLINNYFVKDIHFMTEDWLALAFWIATTLLFSVLLYGFLRTSGGKKAARFAALVPVLSYFFLYVIYLSALIGNFNWGSTPTYQMVWRYLPDLFELANTFMISKWITVSLLIAPLALFFVLFQWRADEFRGGIERILENFEALDGPGRNKRVVMTAAAWIVVAAALFSSYPGFKIFGHFRYDPIVGFFKSAQVPFSMTTERAFWVKEDEKAAVSVHKKVPKVHNIVLFIVDALRADHLPLYGYSRPVSPYLLGLSREPFSKKIDWDLSTGSESVCGINSILSSKEVKDMSHLDYTLPDYLADMGFQTEMIYSGDSHMVDSQNSFGRKFSLFVDDSNLCGPAGIDDDRMILEELDQLKPYDGKYHFICIHLMSVHEAGYVQPKYIRYKPAINFLTAIFKPDQREFDEKTKEVINMYDDGIMQADDIIKEAMGKLRKKGYLRDYVGVITADHGQLLGEHKRFGHTRFVSIAILHVPLLFFGSEELPGFAQSRFATSLDIAPTLADIAGLEIPFSWQGQSLLKPRKESWTYHFTPSVRIGNRGAVIYEDQNRIIKYSRLLAEPVDAKAKEAVFDILKDPHEKVNLIKTIDPDLLKQMRLHAHEHLVDY